MKHHFSWMTAYGYRHENDNINNSVNRDDKSYYGDCDDSYNTAYRGHSHNSFRKIHICAAATVASATAATTAVLGIVIIIVTRRGVNICDNYNSFE